MKLYDVLCSEWFVGKHHVGRIFPEIYEGITVSKVYLHVLFRPKKVIFRLSVPKKMINMTFEFDEFDELRPCRTFKAVSDTLIQA